MEVSFSLLFNVLEDNNLELQIFQCSLFIEDEFEKFDTETGAILALKRPAGNSGCPSVAGSHVTSQQRFSRECEDIYKARQPNNILVCCEYSLSCRMDLKKKVVLCHETEKSFFFFVFFFFIFFMGGGWGRRVDIKNASFVC